MKTNFKRGETYDKQHNPTNNSTNSAYTTTRLFVGVNDLKIVPLDSLDLSKSLGRLSRVGRESKYVRGSAVRGVEHMKKR